SFFKKSTPEENPEVTSRIKPAPRGPSLHDQLAHLNALISSQEASRGMLRADSWLYARRTQIRTQLASPGQSSTQSVVAPTLAQMVPGTQPATRPPSTSSQQAGINPTSSANMQLPNAFSSTGVNPVPPRTSAFSPLAPTPQPTSFTPIPSANVQTPNAF